jgi:hypothetical protein
MKIHRTIPALLVLMIAPLLALSQASSGKVEVIQDSRVDQLVAKHIELNQNRAGAPGYRIQIFFDSGNNSKTKGQTVYEEFRARYPEVPAYLTFKAPNYKVRVGDFRTRLEAVRFLQDLLPVYPGAYVITDWINISVNN